MKRKHYFKDKAVVFIAFPAFAILNLLTMTDASMPWRIAAQVFFWGIPTITAIYGLIKYKE